MSRSQTQAQRPSSAEEKSKTEGAAAVKQQSSASKEETPSAPSLRAGTKISDALESAVDTRTAKPGDEVVARVTKNVKQDGKTIVHKGDRLIGRVQSVEANAAGDAGSHLGITFDRLAHGEATTQLHTVISSILSTPGEQQQGPMGGPEPMAMPMPAPSAASGSTSGGGLLGGVTSTVGSTVGAAGSVAGSTGQAAGGAVGATAGSTLGANSNTGATLATPARAIRLESQAQGQNQTSASSLLSTRHGQLHLDSGTEMQFRVAGQAERQPNKP